MKPSELLTKEDKEDIYKLIQNPNWPLQGTRSKIIALLCPVGPDLFYNLKTPLVDLNLVKFDTSYKGIRPKVSNHSQAVPFYESRLLAIGVGGENQLQLEKYGYCNNISRKHAVIFYCQVSKRFGLKNYSKFGSKINSMVYFGNMPMPSQKANEPMNLTIRNRGRKRGRKENPKIWPTPNCNCGRYPAIGPIAKSEDPEDGCVEEDQPGWKGSALLRHGSLIYFGCRAFVFSVLD